MRKSRRVDYWRRWPLPVSPSSRPLPFTVTAVDDIPTTPPHHYRNPLLDDLITPSIHLTSTDPLSLSLIIRPIYLLTILDFFHYFRHYWLAPMSCWHIYKLQPYRIILQVRNTSFSSTRTSPTSMSTSTSTHPI